MRQSFEVMETAANPLLSDVGLGFDSLNKLLQKETDPAGIRNRCMEFFNPWEIWIEEFLVLAYLESYKIDARLLGIDPEHIPRQEVFKVLDRKTKGKHDKRGKTWYERFRNHARTYQQRVIDINAARNARDLSGADAANEIDIATGRGGAGGISYRISSLIRTEAARAANAAALRAIDDSGREFYKVVAILDDATCTGCFAINGRVFPVKEARPGVNLPPFHPNCRCYIEPV